MASRPNEVWALDFQFDETSDHRRLKLLNIGDEFTREALAMRVGRIRAHQNSGGALNVSDGSGHIFTFLSMVWVGLG